VAWDGDDERMIGTARDSRGMEDRNRTASIVLRRAGPWKLTARTCVPLCPACPLSHQRERMGIGQWAAPALGWNGRAPSNRQPNPHPILPCSVEASYLSTEWIERRLEGGGETKAKGPRRPSSVCANQLDAH
jgi:hypothetical protein